MAFNVVNEECFGGIEVVFFNNPLKSFRFGLLYLQCVRIVRLFKMMVENIVSKFVNDVLCELFTINLVGVAEQKDTVLLLQTL